jgi:hypothetical protein
MGGDKHALSELLPVLEMTGRDGAEISSYRSSIFRQGFDHMTGGSRSEVFQKPARKVLKKDPPSPGNRGLRRACGRLSSPELLFCRVRYFSDGLAIGSRNFIEDLFKENRHLFGEKRKTGARPFRNADSGGLCCMRDLRLNPISPPACAT